MSYRGRYVLQGALCLVVRGSFNFRCYDIRSEFVIIIIKNNKNQSNAPKEKH